MRVIVRRPPDLSHDVLCEGVGKELDQLIIIDHVERIPTIEVFLQEKEAHFFLSSDSSHVFDRYFEDTILRLLDSSVHEAEASLDLREQLDDETSRLDYIQRSDKDIATTRVSDSVLDSFYELLCLFKPHRIDESLQQEALGLELTVHLFESSDEQCADLILLLRYFEEVLTIE